jgi:hypothetical protein
MARPGGPALLALLLLGACGSSEPPPVLDLAQLPAIRLNAQAVEFENRAQVPANINFIGRRWSQQLAGDAESYLRARVQAAGGSEFARATVEEATLIERARETSGGLLSTEPTWELVGALASRVAVVDGLGIENGFATARVEIRRSISERASVETKDLAVRELSRDLVAAMSRELDKSVRQNLASYHAP